MNSFEDDIFQESYQSGGEQYTLLELLSEIKESVDSIYPQGVWIVAELSSVNNGWPDGHCYLSLHQTDENSGRVVAKASAHIWKSRNYALTQLFREQTGGDLAVGMKVLIKVVPDFSQAWGFSFNIVDIEPTYTLGALEAKRRATLERLQREMLVDKNKELAVPLLPKRVAVVSSESAAGYGDFMRHLRESDIAIYTELFDSPMQGDTAPDGIFRAFEQINSRSDEFDVVVFIRGGGSELDLSCFDDYTVALAICSSHLPVISGIGHERDNHICDIVSSVRVKTPTAAAAYLIDRYLNQEEQIAQLQDLLFTQISQILEERQSELEYEIQNLLTSTRGRISEANLYLERLSSKMLTSTRGRVAEANLYLERLSSNMLASTRGRVAEANLYLARLSANMLHTVENRISNNLLYLNNLQNSIFLSYSNRLHKEQSLLELYNEKFLSADPSTILKRGYALVDVNGKKVSGIEQIQEGARMRIQLRQGSVEFIVGKLLDK